MTIDRGLAPRETTPDPKPAARIVDRKAFADFYATVFPVCQCCGLRSQEVSIHHLVSRSQGGDDVHANFAFLCGHGTGGCHGDVEHYRNGARERLRQNMTPEQLRYVVVKKGTAWLDVRYPWPNICPDCGERIINRGAHYERCFGPTAKPTPDREETP